MSGMHEVAPAGSCGLHSRADGVEGGGEVGECRRERGAGVSDRKGEEFDSSLVSLEGHDEGGVFFWSCPQVWFHSLGLCKSRTRRR